MCGIAGCYTHTSQPQNMERVLQKLTHRGPDDFGFYSNDPVWLGNTRLAVQDLSHRGHQPMHSADGRFVLVYNGELYNNAQLRKDLQAKGTLFTSSSDTETLLQAYINYGKDCLQYLNGIFAFAVYDVEKQELFIARDPLGVKPLYFYEDDHQFLFASELKALAHIPGLDYTLRPEVFYNYLLLLYSPDDSTPFRKIHKLLPGHFIIIKEGKAARPTKYYQIPFTGNYDAQVSKATWISRTDAALNKAVNDQMISDAPVGFFLSGGLDSSLITAIAKQQFPDNQHTCFTIDTGGTFRKEGFEDDLYFARLAAKKLGVDLVEVSGQINIAEELDAMVWHLDEPQADPAALHVLHIAEAAKARGIKVLLGGAGADDIFSGYRRHQALSFEKLTNLLPASILKMTATAAHLGGMNNASRRITKLTFAEGEEINKRIGTHFWLQPNRIKNLFQPDITRLFSVQYPYEIFRNLLTEIPDEHSPLNQMLYWEMRTFLPQHNLNYTDKMSMAAGVEARVPYLDINLIALAAQMPPELKMKGRETKYILREVAKKYLPAELIYRKKTGFGAPLRHWISGDLQPLIKERLLSGGLEKWNIFNQATIEQLIQDHERGTIDAAYPIFALLAIESWLRQFAVSPNFPS